MDDDKDTTEDQKRKRPKPGERRIQILQTLAQMLETPAAERITTASLAAKLGVSEAALYRHFASKAQMYEALIEFVESSILGLLNKITASEAAPALQLSKVISMLLQFAEKNPGMSRVMAGDALVLENERLQQRMNALFDKLEAQIKQILREKNAGSNSASADAQTQSSILIAFSVGRIQRFVRSGFKRMPTEHLDASLQFLLA